MTNSQKQRLKPLLKKLVMEAKQELREGSHEVVAFEKWAKSRARNANMDVDAYINRLLHDLSFAYDMPKSFKL